MKNKAVNTVGKSLSFDEAADSIFVAVKRGPVYKVLAVAKIMTEFYNGIMDRIIILSDGSHYCESKYDGRIFAA